MEVIAKLCGSVSQSSLQMVENPDGTALHPLMQRLHEIAAEAGGNVTYTAVKAVLVSEFGQNVFEEHKTTVKWDLEHMAQYVTEEVQHLDSVLAQSMLSKTMSDTSMSKKNSHRRMLSSSLSSRRNNSSSQINLLSHVRGKKNSSSHSKLVDSKTSTSGNQGSSKGSSKGSGGGDGSGEGGSGGGGSEEEDQESPVVMGLPPWKMVGSCLEGSLLYVQVAALTSLQCLLNGRSPLTGIEDEGLGDVLPSNEDYSDDMWEYSTVDTPILGLLHDIDNPHLIQKINHNSKETKKEKKQQKEKKKNEMSKNNTNNNIDTDTTNTTNTTNTTDTAPRKIAISITDTTNTTDVIETLETVEPSTFAASSMSSNKSSAKKRSSLNSEKNKYIEYDALRNGGDYQRDSYRMEVLMPSYIALPPHCLLKAQAALVIGSHFLRSLDKEDWLVAERILFECVYCLDKLNTKVESIGILSDLGIEALVLFADALCKNDKYRYGILAYEGAIEAYKLVNIGEDFQKMARRLCVICREHGDWKRVRFKN